MRSLVSVVVVVILLAVAVGTTVLVMKGVERLKTESEATVASLLEAPANDFSIRTNRQRNGFVLPDGTVLSGDFFLHALKFGDMWSGSGMGAFVVPGRDNDPFKRGGGAMVAYAAWNVRSRGELRYLR